LCQKQERTKGLSRLVILSTKIPKYVVKGNTLLYFFFLRMPNAFFFNTFYIVLEIVFHFQLEIFIFVGVIKNIVTLHFSKGLKKLHNLLEGWNFGKNNKVLIFENLFLAIFEHENFDFNLYKWKCENITSKRHVQRSR
jgi:hypothetical protein